MALSPLKETGSLKKNILCHKTLTRTVEILAVLSISISVLSYASYQKDCRFFASLADILLENNHEGGGQKICLPLLAFSSGIPPLCSPPYRQVPLWVHLYYRLSPLKPDPFHVLRFGTDCRGPCGSRSRVLAALLESRDIPVRLTALHVGERAVHTVVEAKCSQKWVILDPTYNLFFRSMSGELMSKEEIKAHPEIFWKTADKKQGTGVPYHTEYPTDTYTFEEVYPFNWEAIPFLLPLLKKCLNTFFAHNSLSQWFHWPESYRRPKLFTAKTTLFFSLFFIFARLYLFLHCKRQEVLLPP